MKILDMDQNKLPEGIHNVPQKKTKVKYDTNENLQEPSQWERDRWRLQNGWIFGKVPKEGDTVGEEAT